MIVKVVLLDSGNLTIRTKPSHRGKDREHAVDIVIKPIASVLVKLNGKKIAYFHAHLKEDTLVLDDIIADQRW
jgi:hypothetical protein